MEATYWKCTAGFFASLLLVLVPVTLYYFYKSRRLEEGVFSALKVIKHYHTLYYRTARAAFMLRSYAEGLVKRYNDLRHKKGAA